MAPAVITTDNRVFRAIEFKNSNLYVGIGRTTAWPDEENPPTPAASITEVEELLYIKKIIEKRLVIQDYSGELEHDGTYYTEVSEANAYTQDANSVFMRVTIHYADVDTSVTYRQAGVLMDPEDVYSTILTGTDYLAAAVGDQGVCHFIENFKKVQRDDSQSEELIFLIDF